MLRTAAPELLYNPVENLVPIAINKLKEGHPPGDYGTQCQTRVGTCIRDLVGTKDITGLARLLQTWL